MYGAKEEDVKNVIDEACEQNDIQNNNYGYYEIFEKAVAVLQPSIYLELKNHIENNFKNEKLKKCHLEILMRYQPMAI